MDITVTTGPGDAAWTMTDLLGRAMGRVVEEPSETFRIEAAGLALETMKTMKHGPFASLDAALAEIERFTRGSCRRSDRPPGEAPAS